MQLRPIQKQALEALKEKIHLICVAPTGSGKSLIFEREVQKPNQRMILVTPLIALARQQYLKLKSLGVSASLGAGPDSQGPPRGSGAWIISPEKLFHPEKKKSLEALKKWRPNLLVVDECHCLWEWGESFRPAFKEIPTLLQLLKIPKSIWLTATLPPNARKEIKSHLGANIKEIGEFDLPQNLSLTLRRTSWPDRLQTLLYLVHQQKTPGMIFSWTRESTERLTRVLEKSGKRSIAYHAGMSPEERTNLEKMIQEKIPDIVVATSAFGMGMDHRHLGWVVLWQIPPNLLTLAQSIGRVGRAETKGKAYLLWDQEDFKNWEWSIQGSEKRKKELLELLDFLNSGICRRQSLRAYFNEKKKEIRCGQCDICHGATAYSASP